VTLDATTYFEHLKAYLNDEYIVHDGTGGEVVLKGQHFVDGDPKPKVRIVKLHLSQLGMAFKLDSDDFVNPAKSTKNIKPALFHFLDATAKPWSRRCDFLIFRTHNRALYADCIEFKSKSLSAEKIVPQLKAGICWCRSLKHTIEHYTGDRRKIRLRKFVFAENDNPNAYLNPNRQLKADPSIRYYHFNEVQGQALADLQNASVQEI
jgi:hypothetical protein